jgi:DNA polymerase (family 10)
MKLSLSKSMTNQEIGEIFEFISQVLQIEGNNFFRARSYEEAAEVIKHWDEELSQVFIQKSADKNPEEFKKYLDDIPGIGESILKKLTELFTTGDIKPFQKYVKKYPGGILPLTQIHGIGGKRAYQLAEHFKLDNQETAVDDLLQLAKSGKIRDLPGWGEKSELDLTETLAYQHKKSRIPYEQALEVAEKLLKELDKLKIVKKAEFLGSLRRKVKTVGDIDLGVAVEDISQFKKELKDLTEVDRGVGGR